MEDKDALDTEGAKVISMIDRNVPVRLDTMHPSNTLLASYISFTTLDQILDDHFRELEEFGE